MAGNADELAVSRLANRLAAIYYSFLVAHLVAINPESINSLPPPRALGQNPVGEIKRKDGSAHTLDLRHYLDLLRTNRELQEELLRTWATSAILTLGDALKDHDYFGRPPILELVYHLRNGVAHGNRFKFTRYGLKRLAEHPAHNRDALVRSPLGITYEIAPQLAGKPVLFDFLGAADVIDLLQSVEVHLGR